MTCNSTEDNWVKLYLDDLERSGKRSYNSTDDYPLPSEAVTRAVIDAAIELSIRTQEITDADVIGAREHLLLMLELAFPGAANGHHRTDR